MYRSSKLVITLICIFLVSGFTSRESLKLNKDINGVPKYPIVSISYEGLHSKLKKTIPDKIAGLKSNKDYGGNDNYIGNFKTYNDICFYGWSNIFIIRLCNLYNNEDTSAETHKYLENIEKHLQSSSNVVLQRKDKPKAIISILFSFNKHMLKRYGKCQFNVKGISNKYEARFDDKSLITPITIEILNDGEKGCNFSRYKVNNYGISNWPKFLKQSDVLRYNKFYTEKIREEVVFQTYRKLILLEYLKPFEIDKRSIYSRKNYTNLRIAKVSAIIDFLKDEDSYDNLFVQTLELNLRNLNHNTFHTYRDEFRNLERDIEKIIFMKGFQESLDDAIKRIN